MPSKPESKRRQTPRQRRCLLKGCESKFRPNHPLCRYCSDTCRNAAKRWAQQQANTRYRTSTRGKRKRSAQAARYRQRIKERSADAENHVAPVGEGYGKSASGEKSCDRPGCYFRFAKSRRSPLKKFCSPQCRQALRVVLLREKRWSNSAQRLFDDPEHSHCLPMTFSPKATRARLAGLSFSRCPSPDCRSDAQ